MTQLAGTANLVDPKAHSFELQLGINYRKLQSITVSNYYLLALMRKGQDKVHGTVVFFTLVMNNGHNSTRMKKRDEWKIALYYGYEHSNYCVILFGLINAHLSLQSMINSILKELLIRGVIVYIDDILI